MSSSFDDMVEKMKKAPLRKGGGEYMKPGLFDVEVLSTIRKMAWNAAFTVRDRELFICEFKILTSSTPDHLVGSTASWSCKDPSSDSGSGDVKTFCIAATGNDPRQVKDNDEKAQTQATLLAFAAMGEAEAFKRLGLPENFFVGRKLKLETRMIKTKAGKDFTKHTWSPYKAPEAQSAT